MAQIELVRDLPRSGREIIRGCEASISYTRESEGPFQGWFKRIQLNCQVCGIASASLGPLLDMNVPLSEEKVPQETKQFLNYFCRISRGLDRPRRRRRATSVPTESQIQTPQNSTLLKELGLPPRQGEVLTRMLQGQTPKEIRREMHVEISTVYSYLGLVRRALEAKTTAQAIAKAIGLGFEVSYPVPPEP